VHDLRRDIREAKRFLKMKTKELMAVEELKCSTCGLGIYWVGRGKRPSFCESCNKDKNAKYHADWAKKKKDHLRNYKRKWRENRRKLLFNTAKSTLS